MSLAQLKEELTELSPDEQGEVMAFLGAIQIANDDALREELTRKIDDNDPARWMDLSELKRRWAN